MMTEKLRQQIVAEMLAHKTRFVGCDAQFAKALGIRLRVWNRLLAGETEGVIDDSGWLTLARKYNIGILDNHQWRAAETDVFRYITTQLEYCQQMSVGGIFCDAAGIGKTFASKIYAENNANAVYVDCSQSKSIQLLIRAIARGFGLAHTGKYHDVYSDLAYYLRTLDHPLVILDEAGDLRYTAFLELKALFNATVGYCAWFMLGADGLKKKLERGREGSKVGFAEIIDRYGKRYQRVTPLTEKEHDTYMRRQAAIIIRENAPQADIAAILASSDGSLRRIEIEIKKRLTA